MTFDPFATIATIAEAAVTTAREAQAGFVQVADRIGSFGDRSSATQPTEGFTLPVAPAVIHPYGYQLAAIETVLSYRRALIGFAPGMGKTIIALCAIAAEASAGRRTVVIVPPTLRIQWEREIALQFPTLTTAIVSGRTEAALPDVDVVIVPDSVIQHRANDIIAWAPDNLVADECARFRTPAAKRTKAIHAIADAVPTNGIVIGLSGTLIMSRPDDAWGPLRMTGTAQAKAVSGSASFAAFRGRWSVLAPIPGTAALKTIGCTDERKLHDALRSSAYVRVEREDVLDMPSKTWAVTGFELNGALAEYRRIEANFIQWVAQEKGRAAAERASKAEAIGKLNTLRAAAGLAKVKAVTEQIQALVDQGEQVVVMGWHTATLNGLARAMTDAGVRSSMVVGGQSANARQDNVDEFLDGRSHVLIGNIIAAGTGLNLANSANLIFIETPWTPGDLVQASDRIYRVTQQRNCTITVANAVGTIDERLWAVLQARTAMADGVNAGADVTITEGSIVDAVLTGYGW